MNNSIKAAFLIIMVCLVSACSKEFREMKGAESQFMAKFSELSKKYDYACSIEAAKIYPTAIATYDTKVTEAGRMVSKGTGKYTGSCSRGYGLGDISCNAKEKQRMTYERGKTKIVTKSYDANSKARKKHQGECVANRIKNNSADKEKLKPYIQRWTRTKNIYKSSK